jgi:3-methyladenine DNA glycosylase/8-oxoguanine DNA glycosylase
VRLTAAEGKLRLETAARTADTGVRDALTATVSHMFRLDEDLSKFYALVAADGELAWCGLGAGRMLRAPTVFEDVVKTICTPVRTSPRMPETDGARDSRSSTPTNQLPS